MGCPKGQLFLFAHLSGKKQSTFALWNGGFSCLYVVFAPVGGACWVCLGFGWMYMKEAQASATLGPARFAPAGGKCVESA